MLRCCSRLQSMAAWQVARYRCAGGAFCSFSFGACLASHFVPLVTDTSEYPLLNLARPLCVLTALDLEDPHSSYWSRSYYLRSSTCNYPLLSGFCLRFAQRDSLDAVGITPPSSWCTLLPLLGHGLKISNKVVRSRLHPRRYLISNLATYMIFMQAIEPNEDAT
jgi:hypothetical protein